MKKLFTLFAMIAIIFGLEAGNSNHDASRCEDASANAGADATICANTDIELYGQAENYTSILWESSGDGTFDDETALETIYYPGSEDITAGNVELCLTAFAEEPCEDDTDCMNLTIQQSPLVDAGEDITICEGSSAQLNGSTEFSSGVFWDFAFLNQGDGTFSSQIIENPVYTPGPEDIERGYVDLIFIAFPIEPCDYPGADVMTILINSHPLADAGEDVTICEGNPAQLNGSAEFSSGVFWDFAILGQGDGTFSSQIIEDPVYAPGPDDIDRGYVDLILVAFPLEPCDYPGADVMTIFINRHPLADAGEDITICEGSSAELDGSAEFSSGVFWDFAYPGQGDGTFSSQIIEDPVYTPGPDDIERGYVELIFVAFPVEPCDYPGADEMTIYINPQATLMQELSLNEGWNGVSLYLQPLDPEIESLFSPIIDDVILMRNLTEVFWPENGINTIGDWDINTGYALKMEANNSLEVHGLPLNTHTIDLQAGWHYLPVLTNEVVSTLDLFAPMIDDIVFVKELVGTKVFWPEAGVFSLEYLNPGQSYLIKNSNEISLSFPESSKLSVTASQPTSSINSVWGIVSFNPGSHVILFDETILSDFHENDQIGAFDANKNCFGVMACDNSKGNKVLILNMDDPTTPEKDGFTENERLEFRLWDSGRGKEHLLEVTFDQTMPNPNLGFNNYGLSAVSQMEILSTDIPETENNLHAQIVPNPATTEVFILMNNTQLIEVEFLNQLGKKCLSAQVEDGNTRIDISRLSPGVYLVVLKTNRNRVVKKLIVK